MSEAPAERGSVQVWEQKRDDHLAGGVWTEAVTGRGEDAEPLYAHHSAAGRGILGVFDGAGGAGSAPAFRSRDGMQRTEAWLAARLARIGVESWFCRNVQGEGRFRVSDLEGELAGLLAGWRTSTPSRVKGRMLKELPTTMATVHYRVQPRSTDCRILWAGDSRAYLLSPDTGLQVLTRDDTEEQDGLAQLLQDPPLTNLVSADAPFTVREHLRLLPWPCVLLCATDGFFGYVETPADFEYRLLNALRDADCMRDWMDRIGADVMNYSADDASLSMVALGHSHLDDLRAAFGERTVRLEELYGRGRPDAVVDPAAPGAGGIDDRTRRWREWTWAGYRDGYERLMPPLLEER
ncbi:protein phosphatase 2C domain-containing protein [Actinomadura parmotrematis]|uniref:Protein phosphatase 2C domain-containing protein n=1 Tax=Actinomadura parmotrematis TaxID=2864039 RepID=A0ABS7FZR0_9ACTN|nr:protein phosphatase 2C domain-containing protein [Actinomadura parmotrematis]MBW8485938.1 protein phosphatase 2C domain-containing protein [Actinomadura parmotrematis]